MNRNLPIGWQVHARIGRMAGGTVLASRSIVSSVPTILNRQGDFSETVINNNNGVPTFYLNEVQRSGNSMVIKLEGMAQESVGSFRTNRDAIGAQVRVTIAGKTMMRQIEAGSGFAAEGMLPPAPMASIFPSRITNVPFSMSGPLTVTM